MEIGPRPSIQDELRFRCRPLFRAGDLSTCARECTRLCLEMESEEKRVNGPDHDHESLKDRMAELEDRVARLEKEMESIARMEKAISGLFGGKEPPGS